MQHQTCVPIMSHSYKHTRGGSHLFLAEPGWDPVHNVSPTNSGGGLADLITFKCNGCCVKLRPCTSPWFSSPPHSDHMLLAGSVFQCNQIFDDHIHMTCFQQHWSARTLRRKLLVYIWGTDGWMFSWWYSTIRVQFRNLKKVHWRGKLHGVTFL